MTERYTLEQQKWIDEASCLDAAYERVAILQGLVDPKEAVFVENRE